MKLTECTWVEVDAASREMVVLLPIGAIEQHGPHLPIGTDTLLVTAVAEALESKLSEKLLLLPTIPIGMSDHHLSFSGTLSCTGDVLQASLALTIQSLASHGWRRFYVLNGHGGNRAAIELAVRHVKHASPTYRLAFTNYWAGIGLCLAETLTGPTREMDHAGEAETSLMLYLFGDLVRMDQAKVDGLRAASPVRGAVYEFNEITSGGNQGSPQLASREKGAALFEASVHDLVQELSNFSVAELLVGEPRT